MAETVPTAARIIDEPYCPECNLRMKLTRIEPLPARGENEDDVTGSTYVYRCDCGAEIEKYAVAAR